MHYEAMRAPSCICRIRLCAAPAPPLGAAQHLKEVHWFKALSFPLIFPRINSRQRLINSHSLLSPSCCRRAD